MSGRTGKPHNQLPNRNDFEVDSHTTVFPIHVGTEAIWADLDREVIHHRHQAALVHVYLFKRR